MTALAINHPPQKRDVSRQQFSEAAKVAKWDTVTVDIFLDVRWPIHRYVLMGGELLRVTDWPIR